MEHQAWGARGGPPDAGVVCLRPRAAHRAPEHRVLLPWAGTPWTQSPRVPGTSLRGVLLYMDFWLGSASVLSPELLKGPL